MKYPGNVDISLIIRHALYIQSPDVYERPANIYIPLEMPPKQSKSAVATKSTKVSRKPSDVSVKSNRENGRIPTPSHNDSNAKLVNDVLAKAAHDEIVQMRLRNIQNTTALAAMRISQQSLANHSIGEHDPGIVDGYLEDVSVTSLSTLSSHFPFKLTILESGSVAHSAGKCSDYNVDQSIEIDQLFESAAQAYTGQFD